jgi:hypothetical protein
MDLSQLSEELNIPSLQEEVTQFIADHADALLTPRIRRALALSEICYFSSKPFEPIV